MSDPEEPDSSELTKRCTAEAIGTFALVFVGTGAIVANDLSGGAVSHVGVALAFGLVVMTMIYSVGDLSGAHLNPAVTFGFFIAKRLPGRDVFPYVGSQAAGALFASVSVRALFDAGAQLGATLPSGSASQSFLLARSRDRVRRARVAVDLSDRSTARSDRGRRCLSRRARAGLLRAGRMTVAFEPEARSRLT